MLLPIASVSLDPSPLCLTAGTPRFALAMSESGEHLLVEAPGHARQALAGAALAEAAEQAGSQISGWVTGLIRSGKKSGTSACVHCCQRAGLGACAL